MHQNNHKKFPCEQRERLYAYMSQKIEALVEAQEQQLTELRPSSFKAGQSSGRGFGMNLIAVAKEWKRARMSYEQHIREHGCARCSDKAAVA